MDAHEVLADQFEAHRAHLEGVAQRMLGSRTEADDAVQEAWLRLSRTDADTIDNLGGWLTTVVARVCLDMLRSRTARREQPLDATASTASTAPAASTVDPEHEAMLADSVGLALLVVLETLSPGERVAFVLHDMFAVPFDEIASVIGRSPDATRQLASRARRRVQGATDSTDADRARQHEVVAAFLRAAHDGEFDTLLAMLDPDVVLRADDAAVQTGAPDDVRGAPAVAGTFSGRARGAQVAIVDGAVGLVWAHGGTPQVVFEFTLDRGAITRIEMVADPDVLAELDVVVVRD